MKRTITVYNSSTQKKTVLENVEVNTLGELKQLLSENGINYTSMDFMEGVSQTKLVNDSSVLPSNIPYKGSRTNDLLIYMTLTDKKVSSGADFASMDRRTLLAYVKEKGLVEKINDAFKQNYTRVSTANIVSFLKKQEGDENPKEENGCTTPVEKKESPACNLEKAFTKLVNILYDADIIEDYQHDELLKCMNAPKDENSEKGFSMAEIDEMMRR